MPLRLLLYLPDDTTIADIHDALLPLKAKGSEISMYINLNDSVSTPIEPAPPWTEMAFTKIGDKLRQLNNIRNVLGST